MQRIYTLLLIYTSAQKGITTAVASCWPWEYKRPEQRDRRNGRTSFVAICLMYRHMRRERGFWVIIMRTGDFRMLVPICWIWTFCRSTFLSLSLSLSYSYTHTSKKAKVFEAKGWNDRRRPSSPLRFTKRSMQKYAKVGYDGTYTSRGREARRVFVRFSDAPILCPYFIFDFSFYLVAKNNAQKIQQQQQKKTSTTTIAHLFGFTLEKTSAAQSPRMGWLATSLPPWTSFFVCWFWLW